MADKYGITSIPTLIFMDENGTVVNKLVGVVDRKTIDQNADSIVKQK